MSFDLLKDINEIIEEITDDVKDDNETEKVSSMLDTDYLNSISTFELKPIKRFGDLDKIWTVLHNFKYDIYICGGYVRWMCSPRRTPVPPSDIDIYCKTMDVYNQVKSHLMSSLSTKNSNDISITFFRPINTADALFGLNEIQLIQPMKKGAIVTEGSLQEILHNFDFTIARIGIDYQLWENKSALADSDFDRDELAKKLIFKNIHCPVSSLFRCTKYCNKGYRLKTSEIIKLFLDWEKRTPEYRKEIVSFFGDFEVGKNMTAAAVSAMYNMLRVD